jgi:hypothetical protein
MGDNEYPGTIDFLYIVRGIVDEGAFQDFAPPVYRRIRKRAKGRRFLIRPFEELPHYWRIASDREKIEYCGQCYDRDSEILKILPTSKASIDEWGAGDEVDKGWQNDLVSGGNEWVLAMTVHSYASHIYDRDEDDDRPTPMDICFGKKNHPGNEALKKAIRKNRPEYNSMVWAPPVYKAIKSDLRGRRYFVPLEQGGWQQATPEERRTEMGTYYNAEKNAAKSRLSIVSESSSKNLSPKKKRPSSKRYSSRSSTKERPKPRDEDVCFGLADHPGTKSFQNAVIQCLADFETTPWSPPVYKAIRAQLKDARFFIRTGMDSPWKEATAQQRLERVRKQFELSGKKKRMKVGS